MTEIICGDARELPVAFETGDVIVPPIKQPSLKCAMERCGKRAKCGIIGHRMNVRDYKSGGWKDVPACKWLCQGHAKKIAANIRKFFECGES